MWELHGFKAHHWVVLGCGERLGGGGSTEQGGLAAEASDGEVAPARVGRGEVVWELCGLTAELARVSARAEDGCSGVSTAAWSSPTFGVERRRRSVAWERGIGK